MTFFADNLTMDYTRAIGGESGLKFDDRYRYAQLPLVAPGHPAIISQDAQGKYNLGKRNAALSYVVPISYRDLMASAVTLTVLDELKQASFGRKLNWDMLERRSELLHATLGTVNEMPEIGVNQLEQLGVDGFQFRLKGLFRGSFNTGRLYIQLYPEIRDGKPITDEIGASLGLMPTRTLLCGFLNFTEELNFDELAQLDMVLERSQDATLSEQFCDGVNLMKSFDDLVLSSEVIGRHRFTSGPELRPE